MSSAEARFVAAVSEAKASGPVWKALEDLAQNIAGHKLFTVMAVDMTAGLSRRVDLFERSPVTALKREGGTWTAVTPRGTVTAPKVILGVNGHIDDFGHFRGRLMHIFAYASMTAPLPPGMAGRERWALLPADAMGATVRKITSGGQSQRTGRIEVPAPDDTSSVVPLRHWRPRTRGPARRGSQGGPIHGSST